MADPAHIVRAKELLRRVESGGNLAGPSAPAGVVTLADILAAEKSLAAAQTELRDYTAGTDGMRETLDSNGIKGLVVDAYRFEKLENLEARVSARRLELQSVKRAWLAGILRED